MPLDAAGFTLLEHPPNKERLYSLADAVEQLGIVPVSDDFLERHKDAELAKHGGNFLYRHRHAIPAFGSVSFGGAGACAVISFGLTIASVAAGEYTAIGTFLMIFCVCIVIMVMILGVMQFGVAKGPARWSERKSGFFKRESDVPQSFQTMALAIQGLLPSATFIVGRLHQDAVPLDPYLLVEYNFETIVVGIWDGKKIIASATQS